MKIARDLTKILKRCERAARKDNVRVDFGARVELWTGLAKTPCSIEGVAAECLVRVRETGVSVHIIKKDRQLWSWAYNFDTKEIEKNNTVLDIVDGPETDIVRVLTSAS